MNNTSVDGPSLGPPDLPYTPYHPPHMDNSSDANRRYLYSNGPTPARGQSPVPAKRSGSVSDDGNRSRNAKAQRRHREKRKAQLRLLEHKVVELEAQCESLTHKLNQCVSEGRGPIPSMQEFEALQAENAYLRQENAELRRNFGGRPPYPGPGGMPPPGVGLEESKSSEGRFQGDYSPRGYERANVEYNHDTGSNPSSSSGFHVDPMSRQHRSRMSLSSGLNSSPYVPSTPAFPDPRHHIDGRYSSGSGGSTGPPGTANGSGNGNGAYDHPGYPHGPPPHVIPRNGAMYPQGEYNRENESWNNGPPPFTPQNPYAVYPDSQNQSQGQGQYTGTPNHHQSHEFPDQGNQGQGQGQGQQTPHAYGEASTASHSNEDF